MDEAEQHIILALSNGSVLILDLETNTIYPLHNEEAASRIYGISFVPKCIGLNCIVVWKDDILELWELQLKKCIKVSKLPLKIKPKEDYSENYILKISPNGKWIVAAYTNQVIIWDITSDHVDLLELPNANIWSMDFNPEEIVVSLSTDQQIFHVDLIELEFQFLIMGGKYLRLYIVLMGYCME